MEDIMSLRVRLFVVTFVCVFAALCIAQDNKCPQGFNFAGRLYGSGSFGSNFAHRVEIQFPPNVRIDSSYQQGSVHAENGQSDAHSRLNPQAIPKGIHIVPFGSDDHEKGWAVDDPELKGIAWDDDGRITRYGFGMQLYCTTGSGEADRIVGGCNVDVDVCYKPKGGRAQGSLGGGTALVIRGVNLRRNPSSVNKPIAVLQANTEVQLLSPAPVQGFYKVKTRSGLEGWVGANFLKVRA
jgi:hypothetical protein